MNNITDIIRVGGLAPLAVILCVAIIIIVLFIAWLIGRKEEDK